ncbi:adenylate/guanylate cyclase domain-containing protein [Enhydrobacter sp.]|jgi:adenylate cyclase|uniref:adenylate/guanylate cyclase domain-containing protein n=1 Tax=Enhydrobacter sp. TaxID=1894999 RepID=UPI00261AB897|nr:adenylate/guanylate cyclase domain-containing protein [Enhydrobacter sp.]WIM13575.1 MAG: Adenylate cyclase / Guanylate cyclase [Enhydrobacter sp.]
MMPARDDVTGLVDWILAEGCNSDDLGAILAGTAERLVARGIPLCRATLSMPTIDPTTAVIHFRWLRDEGLTRAALGVVDSYGGPFQRSPIRYLIDQDVPRARWKLEDPEVLRQFELFADLRAQGMTEYALRLVPFSERRTALQGMVLSLASDRPAGFAEAEIDIVDRILPALGLAAYRVGLSKVAAETLGAYLGPQTGARVLQGVIRRGDSQVISAALLLADLRGFSALADRAAAKEVVGWLNQHLECIGDAVIEHGGEILKFLGDGLLAIFPSQTVGAEQACRAVLAAAVDARRRNAALNARRSVENEPTLDLSIALHFGDVVYGNIGTARRLDFTVIGPAVNEVSRMETLGKALGHDLLLSQSIADHCGRPVLSLGAHELRGIAGRRGMYTVG